ncbi:Dimer-Tnp-hAT multi-domain protein [Pyrenophora tritici-repentis]|nr:Dimer-Tnp-hAT multi-domain protein [Pyrenophora tritici-repentis]
MPSIPAKRKPEAAEEADTPFKRAQRTRKPTLKALLGDGSQPTQPIELPESTPDPPTEPPTQVIEPPTRAIEPPCKPVQQPEERPRRASPLPILAASQASRLTDEPAWESQLMFDKPEDSIVQPLAFSSAATEASVEEDSAVSVDFRDFEGVDWSRLKGFVAPLSTPRGKASWIFQHGWRVWKEGTHHPDELYFVCKYCHIHKLPNGVHRVTKSTTAANGHLQLDKPGHRLSKDGPILSKPLRKHGQQSLRQAALSGVKFSLEAYKTIGNFDVQEFRQAAALWLVDNNRPLREFETPAFRKMIRLANPEAEAALWRSHNSVSAFVMRLYSWLRPQVVRVLAEAESKVHISFDGWTTKGGKRGFFSVVAHYANSKGAIVDLPIALPQLVGAHTGEAIADAVTKILQSFSINRSKLGYFVLDNAYNNDTAVNKLAAMYHFSASDRRLRCACHILNLVGQTIMFGRDADAYNNALENTKMEDFYMKEWRKEGPLGVYLDIINYINTPKQWSIFEDCQREAVNSMPTGASGGTREPIKPCVTRWNSYYDCFKRGVQLQQAINAYATYHIRETEQADEQAAIRGNKLPDVPRWMRSDGLTAADWAVITEYMAILQPLKFATDRLQGRGKCGRFGALYEVIPVFESVITELDARLRPYESVNHEPSEAPEDHIPINLRAARRKASNYFTKILQSPIYYAATALHPRYKTYSKRFWRDKPTQLSTAHAKFLRVWAAYKPAAAATTPTPAPKPTMSSFDDAIDAILDEDGEHTLEVEDEYDSWLKEPMWTSDQHKEGPTAVQYWLSLKPKYPHLSRLAIDVLTIPASSSDCERVFAGTGDIIEPQRRKIGAQLLAALVCLQRWTRAGFTTPSTTTAAKHTDEELTEEFAIGTWEEPPAELS